MKNTAYRAKCIDKVLSKNTGLDIMLELADIANDIFQISLKDKNKKLTTRQNATNNRGAHQIGISHIRNLIVT